MRTARSALSRASAGLLAGLRCMAVLCRLSFSEIRATNLFHKITCVQENKTKSNSNKHTVKMSAVDDILKYKRKDDEDFYKMLGCDEHSSVEQITTEYKQLALQYHPDKNDGDKEAEEKFQKLKEAKETLCDPAKRINYDKWRSSGISISYKQWLGMKEHVHQSMHWSTPKTKDRMLPDGSSGPSSLGAGGPTAAQRRASEGGANLHWGGRGAGAPWGSEAPSEVVNKFRNYEI